MSDWHAKKLRFYMAFLALEVVVLLVARRRFEIESGLTLLVRQSRLVGRFLFDHRRISFEWSCFVNPLLNRLLLNNMLLNNWLYLVGGHFCIPNSVWPYNKNWSTFAYPEAVNLAS